MTKQQLVHPEEVLTGARRRERQHVQEVREPAQVEMRMLHGFLIVDLCCGGGGSLTGILDFLAELGLKPGRDGVVIGVNHSRDALDTIEWNHPEVEREDCNLETKDPEEVLKGREITLLWRSLSCQPYSDANRRTFYKRPQKRTTPDYSRPWQQKGRPLVIIEENVPPMARKWKGWKQHLRALEEDGYVYDVRVRLNAADYGVPQSRERLIVIAVRKDLLGDRPIPWAPATHSKHGKRPGTRPWLPASLIVRDDVHAPSVFGRKRPYALKRRRRLARFLREKGRFYWPLARAVLHRHGKPVPLARALQQCPQEDWPSFLATNEQGELVVRGMRYVEGGQGGAIARDRDQEPMSTVVGAGYLCAGDVRLLWPPRGIFDNDVARPLSRELRTITAERGSQLHVAEVVFRTVERVILPHHGERPGQKPRIHRAEDPHPAIPASRAFDAAFVRLVVKGIKDFLVDARDVFLDIVSRPLMTEELAAGQTFPPGYRFAGRTKRDRDQQVGNAVPCKMAYHLVRHIARTLGLLQPRGDDLKSCWHDRAVRVAPSLVDAEIPGEPEEQIVDRPAAEVRP